LIGQVSDNTMKAGIYSSILTHTIKEKSIVEVKIWKINMLL